MNEPNFSRMLLETQKENSSSLVLDHGSRVAVIGGGPAGSFFSYFLLDMAERVDLKLHVDIYEPRDFTIPGPTGCNMCGGVIYESLVQSLAVEGINLPPSVVQRGIEFNMLHLDIGSVQIQTPLHEKRIATTFRGAGPRNCKGAANCSLDGYLMQTAIAKGARHICGRVKNVRWLTTDDTNDSHHRLLQIRIPQTAFQSYELVAVTSGVNTAVLKQFRDLDIGYKPPKTTKLLTREYLLGEETVSKYVGPVFHAFLLDIPGLDYGAIIPKGEYITICLLSSHGDLDAGVMDAFLKDPAVKKALPPKFSPDDYACYCGPRINVMGHEQPFGDRIVFIGDSGVSRLYKDGIGATYRAAKIAASTAIFQGISANDFKQHYQPFCRKMDADNRIGKFLFRSISQIQKMQFARRAILRMVTNEQQGKANPGRGMSTVMWDMLTGGALYNDVLKRVIHPLFLIHLLENIFISLISSNGNQPDAQASQVVGLHHDFTGSVEPSPEPAGNSQDMEIDIMDIGALGKIYQDGEIIVREGEIGDCMYVVQDGFVEVIIESEGQEVQLNLLGKNEFFGEMAVFEHEVRTATVRAKGPARILTVDHRNLLQRIHEDPSLAYQLMEVMSNRIDRLSKEVLELNQKLAKRPAQLEK